MKKALITFNDGSQIIVEMGVEDAKAAVTGTSLVDLPINKKAYTYALNFININDKINPVYHIEETSISINPTLVRRVEEAPEDLALVYTGSPTIPEEVPPSTDDGTTEEEGA